MKILRNFDYVDITDEEPISDEPISVEPSLDEKVEQLAKQMVEAQKQLEASQEALDYLIMGGM